jgi:hypothetical protein
MEELVLRPLPFVLSCALAASAPALAAESTLLPEVWIYLEAGRYQPTEVDQGWAGWIGAGAGLAVVKGITPYFAADVESILGGGRRPFEATQINYHLEPGVRVPVGSFTAALFFHHVSRHAVDRAKPEAVDWNILGVRVGGALSRSVGMRLSIGHTTQDSLVGYRWEFMAGLSVDVRRPFYAAADVRYVTIEPTSGFAREDFADVRLEGGARWSRRRVVLETFAAFERRNDAYLLVPAVRDRLLLGFRIGDRSAPAADVYTAP